MIVRRTFVMLAGIALAVTLATAKEPKAPEVGAARTPAFREPLAQVLSRFDAVQGQIRTLSAEFVQITRSTLLKEPLVAKGQFCLTKPDSVLWEYSSPEPMRFVVARGEYTGYFPEQKKAEKRDLKRWGEQLFRYFGLGQPSQELGKYYEIALGEAGQEAKGSYVLVLSPKKRRARRNVDEVRLWVDGASLLPVRIDYIGRDGNEREIRFMNTRLNPDLAAGLYNVTIPADVPITHGFSGFDVTTRTD